MYRITKEVPHTLKGITPYVAESIENKIARIMSNKEAIKDTAPLIYTDRKDGVNPDHDIRTDRFEYAVEAGDAIAKSRRAKNENMAKAIGEIDQKNKDLEAKGLKNDAGGESSQATGK